jgi:hypothetical protein
MYFSWTTGTSSRLTQFLCRTRFLWRVRKRLLNNGLTSADSKRNLKNATTHLHSNRSIKWRAIRKAIHQHFMESMVIKQHTKVVDAEAVQMCRDFLIAPEDHMVHPRRYGNSITMSLGEFFRIKVSVRN